MKLTRFAATIAAGVVALSGLVACSGDSSDAPDSSASNASPHVVIGTTDAGGKAWEVFEEQAKKEGVDLEVRNFSDYTTPNKALDEGELDVNLFQHLKFLAEYNNGTGAKLVPIGATEIVPLALFWKDHTSLDGIEGESIAIPNDPSNQGRAINVLVQAGLVTLHENMITPTPADIDQAKSQVSVTPVEATTTTVAYGEGKPAIINNTFLDRAGIDPKTAVFQDDPSSEQAEPYINAFVTVEDRKSDPTLLKLVDIWHTPEVQEAVTQESKGTSVEIVRSGAELEPILERLQKNNN